MVRIKEYRGDVSGAERQILVNQVFIMACILGCFTALGVSGNHEIFSVAHTLIGNSTAMAKGRRRVRG